MITPTFVSARRAQLPSLRFDSQLMERLAKVVEGNILENIMRQRKASGGALARNMPSTVKRKTKLGFLWRGRVMSLIESKERFVKGQQKSWRHRILAYGQTLVIEPATTELANLSEWLQKGAPSKGKRKYRGWFGVSKEGRAALKQELKDWLREQMRAAYARYFRGPEKGTYRPEFKLRS